jgi:hypothetical protein
MASYSICIRSLNTVLDEISGLLGDTVQSAAQMGTDLQRQDASIHDPDILRPIKLQPSIDYTAQILPHHCTCRDRMSNGVEIILNPTLPDLVRSPIGNRVESRNSLASGETRERSSLEELAYELSACDLSLEVDIDIEIVDIDSWLYERVGGADLNFATAERKQGPEGDAKNVGISRLVEHFDNGSCNMRIRNRL